MNKVMMNQVTMSMFQPIIIYPIPYLVISYLAQSAMVLAVNTQASLSRVRRNNIAKEIYGSEKEQRSQTIIVKIELSFQTQCQESVNSSGSNNTKSATVFRRKTNKLTRRWTSVPPQTSLERIESCKLLSRGRKWIKDPFTSKLQAGAKPNSVFNSRGSEIGLHHKGSTRLVVRRYHRTSTSKPLFKERFLLQRVKQGYYMVKLDIKKAYLHVFVDPQYRDLFRFVLKGSHYRWKTMPFGLSTAPRIFTMLLRPVLRMLRDINVSVIAYLDDLLIVGSTKEECLSNLKKTMDLLVKLGFKLNLEKSVLEPTQSITFLFPKKRRNVS
ncbi:hypothetical protein ACTFIW_003884 [Dictyostelium discoideum]